MIRIIISKNYKQQVVYMRLSIVSRLRWVFCINIERVWDFPFWTLITCRMKKKQNEKFLLVTSETHNKSNIHNVVNTKKKIVSCRQKMIKINFYIK